MQESLILATYISDSLAPGGRIIKKGPHATVHHRQIHGGLELYGWRAFLKDMKDVVPFSNVYGACSLFLALLEPWKAFLYWQPV